MFLFTSLSSATTQTTSGSGRDSNSVHSLAKCFYLLHSVAPPQTTSGSGRGSNSVQLNVSIYFTTQTTSGSGRGSNSVHSLAKCFYLLHSVAPHKQRLAVAEARTQFIHLLNVSIYFTQ